MREKILLGMSGGLDSTYSVFALREEGFEVEGAVLRMSDFTDVESAVRSANVLDVPIHILDCRDAFHHHVIDDFVSEYTRAYTPNPCVACNRFVKIASLCEFAKANGISRVATGHYAGVRKDAQTGRFYIVKAQDIRKDQSYVLWRLSQEQLTMLHFPLYEKRKTDIRTEAKAIDLPAAEASESQEICFIPSGDYAAYVENIAGKMPEGDFIDSEGHRIGRHRGIIHYTIGQRKGLGVSFGHPVFVSKINPVSNTVTLSEESAVFTERLVCRNLNFMRLLPGNYKECVFTVKIRYAAKPETAHVIISGDEAQVFFEHPVRAVTPGQSAVFYIEDAVAFGGIIEADENNIFESDNNIGR